MNEREKFDPAELADIEETLPWNASIAGVMTYIYLTQIPEVIGKLIEDITKQGEVNWQRVGVVTASSIFLYGVYDAVKVNIANKNDLREKQAQDAYIASL